MARPRQDVYTPAGFRGELTLEAIQSYLEEELLAISRHFSETTAIDLRPVNTPPLRPREGMIIFADGTNWNPGAGKGVYTYSSGAWVKL